MRRAQAEAEAKKRWGAEGDVIALRWEKRRGKIVFRYRVGYGTSLMRRGIFNGEGGSYEEAFADADRRAAEVARLVAGRAAQ